MYVKLVDGEIDAYPYGIRMLRQDNPNTSFPKVLSDETLSEFGLEVVHNQEYPEVDQRTTTILADSMPTLVDGKWSIGYTEVPKTPEETAEFDERRATENRAQRNDLLTSSDWTQLPDSPVDDTSLAWSSYRSELRNITEHFNWPNLSEEDWPVKPM